MKKMIVALVAVAFAAVTQAATFNWQTSGTNAAKTFYGVDGSTIGVGAIVYLIDSGVTGQSDLIAGLREGKTIADFTIVDTSTLDANSRLVNKEVSYGTADTTYNFYMAIVTDENVFVSADKPAMGQASAASALQFSGVKTATQTIMGDAAYSTAGWYETAAVPEPTSGLLLLLGMAGLALKRKQA